MNPNPNFYRYLPRNPAIAEWGAAVLDAGHGSVPPETDYPQPGHPEDHDFTWEKGRRLGAYSFVYITQGGGLFESEPSGEVTVEAGSVFLVFPDVWHRYRPNRQTGWDEYWVECEGELVDAAILRSGFLPASPVMRVGHDDGLLRCFLNIAETIQQEPLGFEPIIAMRSLEIVARVRSLLKTASAAGSSPPERVVRQVQVRMRQSLGGPIDFHELAAQLGMSYSSFRRTFKRETGMPPGEYFIEMKMNRAKQLLMADMTIQKVADLLGFESIYYFSRLFKSRIGRSPSSYRKIESPDRIPDE